MLRFVTGNIFDAQVDAIVNTVNLVGVMGKGVALQFKERFKQNYLLYRRACREQSINIGNSLVTVDQHQGRQVYLINFPTKVHWRSRSEYSYIDKGLDNLIDIINT
ncbi:MAG: macro domain-containing protein, partial [Muribaculaceae bacterium]|nr:macro domain-containing protein [Muribaculaceae bacterium]